MVSAHLSSSGKLKFKKLNETAINQEVNGEIEGVSSHFLLREPIKGEQLEMGPYPEADARKVVSAINQK